MSRAFIIRPQAEDDLAQAKKWYDKKRVGLGDDFLEHVEKAFETIQRIPLASRPVYQDVSLMRVPKYPYMVFDRVDDSQITVLAIYHTSRDPAGWQSRA